MTPPKVTRLIRLFMSETTQIPLTVIRLILQPGEVVLTLHRVEGLSGMTVTDARGFGRGHSSDNSSHEPQFGRNDMKTLLTITLAFLLFSLSGCGDDATESDSAHPFFHVGNDPEPVDNDSNHPAIHFGHHHDEMEHHGHTT